MGEHLVQHLMAYFDRYGYWTVFGGLLLENAGVPVPGETILLLASFLASSKHELSLPRIMLVAVAAAVCGDNIGYAFGRYFGRPLLNRYQGLFRISEETIRRGETLIKRRGALAIFLARFIAGLRIVAGPIAGILNMDWRRFVVFNLLGGIAWVSAVSLIGYFFGGRIHWVIRIMGRINFLVLLIIVLIAIGARIWHRAKAK
jgi:membrane protein DedA with SNARE-associated domain